MKKKVLLVLSLMGTIIANAQGIGNVRFGTQHAEAMEEIKSVFGEPSFSDGDMALFTNKEFEGYTWNEVMFKFKDGILNEARFFMKQKNKSAACKEQEQIAKAMASKHVMSKDIEEGGTPFYAGGQSPLRYGHLFTIFISPRGGAWTNQLRFGPFKF